jgi:hypothetical protein
LARDWEDTFRRWSKPPSETECEKQTNVERMIGAAIGEYAPLRSHDIRVIPQGSYRNNTNVRQESDVDICVCCMDTFFYDLSLSGCQKAEAGIIDSPYSYPQFKNDVQSALRAKFGAQGISRGDKAFDIHENTYRVDADVVAAFAYRLYSPRIFNPLLNSSVSTYVTPLGTKFYADSGGELINWPEQHYSNGVAKNARTGNRFKCIVRAIKNLKYELEDHNIHEAKSAAPYFIESLIFNVPDVLFKGDSYAKNVRDCIAICYAATAPQGDFQNWVEVNEMKKLFHLSQPWTPEQAHGFLLAAWQYCGFF